jgi:hypothetical protein
MCSAWRFCLSVYDDLLPLGMVFSGKEMVQTGKPHAVLACRVPAFLVRCSKPDGAAMAAIATSTGGCAR